MATLDSDVLLTVKVPASAGQPEISSSPLRLEFLPAFHIHGSDLHISTASPLASIRISASAKVISDIRVKKYRCESASHIYNLKNREVELEFLCLSQTSSFDASVLSENELKISRQSLFVFLQVLTFHCFCLSLNFCWKRKKKFCSNRNNSQVMFRHHYNLTYWLNLSQQRGTINISSSFYILNIPSRSFFLSSFYLSISFSLTCIKCQF